MPILGVLRAQTIVALLVPAMLACESGSQGRDGSVQQTQKVSEVSVRLELPGLGAPALSVLAFRADVSDRYTGDVLGVVDPWAAPAPEGACELRDATGHTRALRVQGDTITLEELGGVSVSAEAQGVNLRPAPRVYPHYADVVGGVIAEAGPVDVSVVPDVLTIEVSGLPERPARLFWAVPDVPRVLLQDQTPLAPGASLDVSGDLVLLLTGHHRVFLEIRPYGAPVAVACAAGAGGMVVVPHSLLMKMTAAAGGVPVSFEAVWRENRMVMAATPPTRVSVEARSSVVVDLRP